MRGYLRREWWRLSSCLLVCACGKNSNVSSCEEAAAEAGVGEHSSLPAEIFAAHRGHAEQLKSLLQCGEQDLRLLGVAAAENRDVAGRSPLHVAAHRGHMPLSSELLRWRADTDVRDMAGQSPLHIAALRGRIGVLRHLLQARADIASQDARGQTSLHVAAHAGHPKVVVELMGFGADVEALDLSGRTPLHLASQHNRPTSVARLLEKRASPAVADVYRRTPLHVSASGGWLASVEMLLEHRADVHARDWRGRSPLHDAASVGSASVVVSLLVCGADSQAKDNRGTTPADDAKQLRRWEALGLLEKSTHTSIWPFNRGAAPGGIFWHLLHKFFGVQQFLASPPLPHSSPLSSVKGTTIPWIIRQFYPDNTFEEL
eukprot:gnl/TRDRNA2_/TRDRNA2_142314_c0_seq1.p1 gnl/TRDRNA2_/TRDRNA2_142314_c0~~gnl/TRDRNA2_/TRDRNA2_142314_c0_seq1.p1  ORF type:complete len:374 (+),score=41.39 gnl/TRDRNA2_/TRDRNA2_142314_c0_seq1:128-1249(+)